MEPGPNPLARRTRELQQAEGAFSLIPSQVYSADAPLPTVREHEAPAPLAHFPGLGRPRAGTLPSTFHLTPSASSSSPFRHLTNGLLVPPTSNGAAGSISLPASGHTTPVSDFAFSSPLLAPSTSSATAAPGATSRLRSGSLTLPSSGISTAFGPNVFASSDWTPRVAVESGLGTPAGRANDVSSGLRSPDSSTYGDDSHVRTLDYLGLDGDSPVGPGYGPFSERGVAGGSRNVAPSMHRLGSTGSLRIGTDNALGGLDGGFGHHSRMRSNTVATFPRSTSAHPLAGSSTAYPPNIITPNNAPSDDEYYGGGGDGSSSYHRSQDSTDSSRLLYATTAQDDASPSPHLATSHSHLESPSRARAATIGILDESREVFMRRRAGTATGITPHAASMGSLGVDSGVGGEYNGGLPSAVTRSMRGLSIGQDDSSVWNSSSSRPLTPDAVSITPPLQQPTRSLWVGNLDPRTSPAELQAVFAPYGAVESLRLIPEKECGFINFVSVADAVRAKDDVLNRLNGQLTKTSGMVRIGFGKDATLAAPASSLAHMRTAQGPVLNNLNSSSSTSASMLEPSLQTAPTRALWIGSIPSSTTPNHLLSIFAPFGAIESARVLSHKSCGFINYERLEDAVSARKALNGREILGAEVGSVRIGFAKVPTKIVNGGPFNDSTNLNSSTPPPPHGVGSVSATYQALQQLGGAGGVNVDQQVADGALQDYRSNLVMGIVTDPMYASSTALQHSASQEGAGEQAIETIVGTVNETQLIIRELSGDDPETEAHVLAVAEPRPASTYYTAVQLGVLNDPRLSRRYSNADAPRLRELRRRLDLQLSTEEVDAIATELLDECVALSSDYIGNTLIQKIFERASVTARLALLERIGPHLAAIGTHKNGTWAVQKIIQCVQTPEEFAIIEQSLQPFTPPLLLNDFGNYVVQGALRFGSPTSDFVFDAMIDRCWEIGSGRFGARSTRQTLENPLASRLNIKRVAAAIVLNSIPLATSSNGVLLVTWLLDGSNFPGRYRLLAPRFAPHLTHLCTHKLASGAVLKIINQRVDLQAARMLLDILFASDSKTLDDILSDQIHGTACITKIVNSSFIEPAERDKMAERVRDSLLSMRVSTVPAYRKLVEEMGLPYQGVQTNGTPPYTSAPTFPQGVPATSQPWPQQHQQQYYAPQGYYPPPPQMLQQYPQQPFPAPPTPYDYSSYSMGYAPSAPYPPQSYPQYYYPPPQMGVSNGGHYGTMNAPSSPDGVSNSPFGSYNGGGAPIDTSTLPPQQPGSPLQSPDHFASTASFFPFSPTMSYRSFSGDVFDGNSHPPSVNGFSPTR